MRIILLALMLMGVLVACEIAVDDPTPTIERAPSLAPSATVLPIISPEASNVFTGRSDPTSAGLAAEGEPSQPATVFALPTDASVPITVLTADGVVLRAIWFGTAQQPAPAILVLHGEDDRREVLTDFASRLQQAGASALLVAMRGYGTSGGAVDWSRAESDVQQALNTLATLPGVQNMSIWAEGRSAIAAMVVCSARSDCIAVGLANPLPDDALLSLDESARRLGNLPTLIVIDPALTVSATTGEVLHQTAINSTLQAINGFTYTQAFDTLWVWLQLQLNSS